MTLLFVLVLLIAGPSTAPDALVERIDARRQAIEALAAGRLDPAIEPRALLSFDADDELLRPEDLERIRESLDAAPARRRGRGASTSVEAARERLVAAVAAFLRRPAAERRAVIEAHQEQRRALEQARASLLERREQLEAQLKTIEAFTAGEADPSVDARALLTIDLEALADPEDHGAGLAALHEAVVAARRAVDAAREDFWRRPKEERDALFEAHAAQPEPVEAAETEPAAEPEEPELDATAQLDEAERAREQALAEAEAAQTEALRRIAEERARLLGVKSELASFEIRLAQSRERAAEHRSAIDGLELAVDETVRADEEFREAPRDPDRLYADVSEELVRARDRLETALDTLTAGGSDVPPRGAPAEAVDASDELDALRDELDPIVARLTEDERALRWELADAYRDDIVRLNAARLRLLPITSSTVRDDVTGFGSAGLQQAGRELDQIALELRYRSMSLPRHGRNLFEALSAEPLSAALGVLKLLLILVLFRAWRARAPAVLERLQSRKKDAPHRPRLNTVVWYYARIRKPLDWLALAGALYLGTAGLEVLPELELVWLIVLWLMAGSATILFVDAVAARQHRRIGTVSESASERIRSLRLLGLAIVYTGLVLSVADALVGRGAIFTWVLRTCWLLLIPIAILLTRWWRPHIAKALDAEGEGTFINWARAPGGRLANFVKTASAGVFLLARGTWRWLVRRAAAFEATRRLLAYLFRREVAKAAQGTVSAGPLLAPATRSRFVEPVSQWVDGVASRERDALVEAVTSDEWTVSALVGERGMGKTTTLLSLREHADDRRVLVVQCPAAGFAGLVVSLAASLGVQGPITPQTLAAALAEAGKMVIAIDDAQRMVRPTVGGLQGLDAFWELSRAAGPNVSWVVAMGAAAWQYVHRARGDRLHFTQILRLPPWTEEQIAALIRARCRAMDVAPSFEGLVVPRQYDDDELDENERAEVGYYRILWDYSRGNPYVASFFWGESLHEGQDGELVVRLFQDPPAAELDGLSLPLQFTLRALVQLEQASKPEIAAAIRLPVGEVDDALRFAVGRGYIERDGAIYSITWPWFRAITTMLQRQHLLAA